MCAWAEMVLEEAHRAFDLEILTGEDPDGRPGGEESEVDSLPEADGTDLC
jgi:hypothetical protein